MVTLEIHKTGEQWTRFPKSINEWLMKKQVKHRKIDIQNSEEEGKLVLEGVYKDPNSLKEKGRIDLSSATGIKTYGKQVIFYANGSSRGRVHKFREYTFQMESESHASYFVQILQTQTIPTTNTPTGNTSNAIN
mmetsp:Transcript_6275/g.8741  ORF Transcript_6275/g.8741 Transcript_6275/m.8741 type:complete len:134 (+) Transcript_6275:37-438(+)